VWKTRLPPAVVALLCCAFAALFSWLAVARHLAFQSHAFDLGNVDQALWSTVHGHPLRFTDMQVGHQVLTDRLAIHVEPLLVPISALYVIWPDVRAVLILQAVVVALGAVPLYLLARDLLGRPWLSLVFPLGYLAHPSLQNAVLDDFHAVALSATFLAWALYFAHRDNVPGFIIAGALAASTKEEVGLLVGALGVWFIFKGRRAFGIAVLGSGLLWFLVCVEIIIPHFNPAGRSPYLSRYAYLGHGVGGILRTLVTDPRVPISALLSADRQPYLLYLVHPLGLVPLLGAPILLLGLPVIAINMLSADSTMYSGYYQYSVELVPLVAVAAIYGVFWTDRARRRMAGGALLVPVLCVLVLAGAVVNDWRWGFTPASLGYAIPSAGPHQAIESAAIATIPSNVPVAAADEMEPHLDHRTWVYLLPTVHPSNGPAAQDIALDSSIPGSPVGPAELHRVYTRALHHGYGVTFADDGVLVLRRGARPRPLPSKFYSFAFGTPRSYTACNVVWGALRLVGYVIHPSNGIVNRARPAVEVETYWTVTRRLSRPPHMQTLVSPAYAHTPPAVSRRWLVSADSPTLDWLPAHDWRPGAVIHVAFVAAAPSSVYPGTVEVALGLDGAAPTTSSLPLVGASTGLVRLGTVQVDP
jgi:uncharacterized membrane protein